MNLADIDQRLKKLEAKSEIYELVVRYFLASDDDDFDGLAETFAPQASFEGTGFESCNSREEIIDYFRIARSHMGRTIHTPHYALVEIITPERASGVVGAHLELAMGDTTVFCAARYLDEYIQQNGAWKFLSRKLRFVHAGSWSDVADSLVSEKTIRWPGAEPMFPDSFS